MTKVSKERKNKRVDCIEWLTKDERDSVCVNIYQAIKTFQLLGALARGHFQN